MKITLRDLFWLVLVVGLALTVWMQHREYRLLEVDRRGWKEKAEALKGYFAGRGYIVEFHPHPDGEAHVGIRRGDP